MSMRQPPRLAAWLLRRVIAGARSEPLLGDLHEEYQTGRTRGWYWRETIVALLVFARRDALALFRHRGARLFLRLVAQFALLVWLIALSQSYRQRCPAPPVLLSASILVLACAAFAEAVASLMGWRSSLLRPGRLPRKPLVFRLSVVAFAAIGFSGGAVTWASTTSCANVSHTATQDSHVSRH
jgi:hypothetical protein